MTAPDPIRAALERLTTMASDELTTPGLWAHSRSRWDDAIAAARAALAAAPEREPSDEELLESAAKALGYKSIPSSAACAPGRGGGGMSTLFIEIDSNAGRIGRFCWANSDTRHPQHYGYVIEDGCLRGWINGGWWGSAFLCSPHPARPGEAW